MQPPIRQGDIPGVQLHHRVRLDVAPEEVWRWLADPQRLARWLAVSVEPRVGDPPGWLLRDVDEAGREVVEEARTIAAEPGRLWVASFERLDDRWESATKLTLRIVGEDRGPSELTVVQQGFERLNLSRCLTLWEHYRRRWRGAFERLRAATSG